jgi:hypothetical protein|tara:strand:+ start:2326 stop:2553 length:228 start_codon:yes stop_codon:yes gene_type:complete
MNEENLFNIQTNQLNKEIEKIQWIVKNSDHLIRAIRKEVTERNADYFNDENATVDSIFRGQSISTFIDNYISKEL